MEKNNNPVGMEPIIDLIWSVEDDAISPSMHRPPDLPPSIYANCGGCSSCISVGACVSNNATCFP